MNRRIAAGIIALAMVITGGCTSRAGKKTQGTKKASTGTYKAADYVTLGDYKGVEVSLNKAYKTDDASVKDYEQTLISNAGGFIKDSTKTKVEKDSIVNVDYKGMKDGKAFDGGTATDVTIDVSGNKDASSGTGYIDGFTDGLVGAEVGSKVDSKVIFPKDYQATDLAGKEVTFQFTVNYICKKADIDSVDKAFLKKNFNVETKDAFYDYAKKKLAENNKSEKTSKTRQLVMNAVLKNCRVNGYPKGLLTKRTENLKDQYMTQNGITKKQWKTFLKQYGTTEEEFDKKIRETVKKNVKTELVFTAIADKEGISLDKTGFNSYIKSLATDGQDVGQVYKKYGSTATEGKDYLQMIYRVNKALEYCVEKATVKEK